MISPGTRQEQVFVFYLPLSVPEGGGGEWPSIASYFIILKTGFSANVQLSYFFQKQKEKKGNREKKGTRNKLWYQKQPLQKKFTPVPPPRIAQSGPGSPANEREA